MPLQSEEVLRQLVEATREAKATIVELHSARAAALDVIKAQKRAVVDAITAAVEEHVGALRDEAKTKMVAGADEIILALERDWRAALHLDA